MKSFSEIYCERHRCTPEQFRRRIFWRTLHRHAVPVAPLFLLSNYFRADLDMIAECGRATSMREIIDECESQRYHPRSQRWLRDRLAIRVSTYRLRQLAKECLPDAAATASASKMPQ